MTEQQVPIKEGFERHHRQKGDRENWEPTNILYLTADDHRWAEANPEAARELGWSVSRYEDPSEVAVTIPKTINKPPQKRQRLAPRDKVGFTIKVPMDERENGTEVLEELLQVAREEWREALGWKEDVPAYYVMIAALTKALS